MPLGSRLLQYDATARHHEATPRARHLQEGTAKRVGPDATMLPVRAWPLWSFTPRPRARDLFFLGTKTMIFIEVLTLGGIMVEICMFLRKVITLGEIMVMDPTVS